MSNELVEKEMSELPEQVSNEPAQVVEEDLVNDGSLDQDSSGNYTINREYYYKMAAELQDFHGIFYKFWQMGSPLFTKDLPTAAIQFERNGNGSPLRFLFNPNFWLSMDDYSRKFVVCHEMLHVVFNHGARMKDCLSPGACNIAMDIVVNHALCEKFDFKREMTCLDDDGVWVEKVFPKEIVETDRSFEYYYAKLPKMSLKDLLKQIAKNGGGKIVPCDDHSGLTQEELQEVMKELSDILSEEEKENLKDIIEKSYQPSEKPKSLQDVDGEKNPGTETGESDSIKSKLNSQAGTSAGGFWKNITTNKVKKKKKWESVIKRWVGKKMMEDEKEVDQWVKQKPRYASILEKSDIFLPTEMDVNDDWKDREKIDVWMFLDTSGSCAELAPRFLTAAMSIPQGKMDRFNVRLFCFDTKVYPIDIDLRKKDVTKKEFEAKLRGFGGTAFDILEIYIQGKIKEEKIKYPDGVFVVTDGYGNNVNPYTPEKWHWFVTEGGIFTCFPKTCNSYNLKDFE